MLGIEKIIDYLMLCLHDLILYLGSHSLEELQIQMCRWAFFIIFTRLLIQFVWKHLRTS
jgi:hypothetical protein